MCTFIPYVQNIIFRLGSTLWNSSLFPFAPQAGVRNAGQAGKLNRQRRGPCRLVRKTAGWVDVLARGPLMTQSAPRLNLRHLLAVGIALPALLATG